MSAGSVVFHPAPAVGATWRGRVGGEELPPGLPRLHDIPGLPRLRLLNPAAPSPSPMEQAYADAAFDSRAKLHAVTHVGDDITAAQENLVTFVRHYLPYCGSADAGEPTVAWGGVQVGRRDIFNAQTYFQLQNMTSRREVVDACARMFNDSIVGAVVRSRKPRAVSSTILLMEIADAVVAYEAVHGDGAADSYYANFTFEDPNLLLRLPGAHITFEKDDTPDMLATSRPPRRR